MWIILYWRVGIDRKFRVVSGWGSKVEIWARYRSGMVGIVTLHHVVLLAFTNKNIVNGSLEDTLLCRFDLISKKYGHNTRKGFFWAQNKGQSWTKRSQKPIDVVFFWHYPQFLSGFCFTFYICRLDRKSTVWTPVTRPDLVCRLLLEKKNNHLTHLFLL